MRIDEDGGKYIAFRIDVYFNDFFISSRNWSKKSCWRSLYLIFEEKRQKEIEKELDCDFIKISVNNMKNDYDLDYGIDYI